MNTVSIRKATVADAQGILEIYAPHVVNSACTFESQVPTINEMEERIKKIIAVKPWLICTINEKVVGYVYASVYRERAAYQWNCECSVYTHTDYSGKGIGFQLYKVLFSILKKQGYRNMYAVISLPNEASVKLHERCGFEYFATYDNVGYKLGEWIKVGWWRLKLNEYDPEPAPPLLFSEVDFDSFRNLCKTAEAQVSKHLY